MIDIKSYCSEGEYNFHLEKLAKDIDEKILKIGDTVVYAIAQRGAGPVYKGKILDIELKAKQIVNSNQPDLNNVVCTIKIKGLKTTGWQGTRTVMRWPSSIAKI